jgi:hypothetical protein
MLRVGGELEGCLRSADLGTLGLAVGDGFREASCLVCVVEDDENLSLMNGLIGVDEDAIDAFGDFARDRNGISVHPGIISGCVSGTIDKRFSPDRETDKEEYPNDDDYPDWWSFSRSGM